MEAGSIVPIQIPLYFIDSKGHVGTDYINQSPCIELLVGCRETGLAKRVFALIDTGANGIYIDSGLSVYLKASPIGEDVIHGATGPMDTFIFNLDFCIPGVPEMQSNCFAAPLRQNRRGYDALLGRSILSMFDVRLQLESGLLTLSAK